MTRNLSAPALDALLLLFLVNLVLQPPTDPDFGWHLRAGLDLIAGGWRMPETDPYSHTVPDWRWVEHAWLADGVIGLLYRGFGGAGLLAVIVLFGAVTGGAFLLATATARAERTARIAAAVVALWVALPFLGARMQMITLLGLSATLWLWQRGHERDAAWWLLPSLMLLWANVHGGFTAGLFVLSLLLAASILVRLIMTKRPALAARLQEPVLTWARLGRLALIVALAAAVTLGNPYGWRLHQEIVESLGNRFMTDTLHEWQPLSPATATGRMFLIYLAGLAIAMACWYRKVEPVRWTVLIVFLLFALRHWRNIPLFLLVSAPLAAELLDIALGRLTALRPEPGRLKRGLLGVTLAIGLTALFLGAGHLERIAQAGLQPDRFFRSTEYPIEAIEWARTHRPLGARLYNDYGWGGFLLWWLPGEKIFIDGRMPAWRVGDRWIFYDYVALTAWVPPELRVLDKYDVDWALIGTGSPLALALSAHEGWTVRYADDKATIYTKDSAPAGDSPH